MSETMRQQIQADIQAAQAQHEDKAAGGSAGGFPARAAGGCSSGHTGAPEGARPGVGFAGRGIPGGGVPPAPDVQLSESSLFSTDQPAVEAEWELSNLPPAHRPEVYTCPAIRSACRTLRAVSHAPDSHYLHLTDSELLHLHSAMAEDRKRTKNAISRGRCKIGDLRATDSIWEKLQSVYFGRIRRPA